MFGTLMTVPSMEKRRKLDDLRSIISWFAKCAYFGTDFVIF